jgi:putative redox protein
MEVRAKYLGGTKFEALTRGHRVVCDQPFDNGGSNAGMTPPELLLAAVGTCAGYYAVEYLNTRALPADELAVRVTASKELRPARLASINVEVTAPGIDTRQQEGLLRAVKTCLVHNTLVGHPDIQVTVLTGMEIAA